jgi:uncharacterized damage-inducible protein DinB
VNSTLETLYNQLESQRVALLAQLKTVNPTHLNKNNAGKWSISEVIGHLVQAERMSTAYMSKKINAIDQVGNTGLLNEIMLGVFIVSQRLPLKYKAPKNLGDKPPSYTDVDQLQTDWDAARQSLKQFLETVPDSGINKKIYRHPIMGRCSVVHALKFFREHLIHHRPQIMRQL